MRENKKQLIRLMEKHKGVYQICFRQVVKNPSGVDGQANDTATVEHLYPKWDLRRLLFANSQNANVNNITLSCRECNTKRDLAFKTEYVPQKPNEEPWLIGMLASNKHS